jgi:hypothetical protein
MKENIDGGLEVEILQTAKKFPGKLDAGDYFVETILACAKFTMEESKDLQMYECQ